MAGGAGDDTYYIDSSNDVVSELAGQGTDTINSSITYTLLANVENLTLTGAGSIDGSGNGLNNIITGNTGDNILNGNGGSDTLNGGTGNDALYGGGGNDILNGGDGNDTLNGGTGKDTFVFDSALNAATNSDTITDFSTIDDTISLDQTIFTQLSTIGSLSPDNFLSSATGAALDANDYILYNSTTGALYYDSDGNGSEAAIQFATLTTTPAITASNFKVV